MKQLVYTGENSQALTNSLLVSEKFGKRHDNVMRDIRNLASNKDVLKIEEMFCEIQQPDSYGRMQDVFVMNRDGFTLLAMGFTGKEALKFKMDYLEAFNKMETLLKSDDYILARSQEILRNRWQAAEQMLLESKEENKLLEKKNLYLQSQNKAQSKMLFEKCFDGIRKSCIFVVLNILKGGITRQNTLAGFFISANKNIRHRTPVWNCNRTTALEVLSNGKGGAVLYSTAINPLNA